MCGTCLVPSITGPIYVISFREPYIMLSVGLEFVNGNIRNNFTNADAEEHHRDICDCDGK